jgi:hypothetical protein
MDNSGTIIFIPTFNDSSELARLVEQIQSSLTNCTILVIDDGSEFPIDIYKQVLKVRLPFNLGLGASTHVAIDFALQNKHENLVRIDADGQHNISDIPKLLAELNNGSDIVIATRTNRDSGSGVKNFLSQLARHYIYLMARISCGSSIPSDLNSGFIGINKRAMPYINSLELDRYPEPQIILYSKKHGLNVSEIEVEQVERKTGESSLKIWPAFRLLYRVTIYSILNLFRRKNI